MVRIGVHVDMLMHDPRWSGGGAEKINKKLSNRNKITFFFYQNKKSFFTTYLRIGGDRVLSESYPESWSMGGAEGTACIPPSAEEETGAPATAPSLALLLRLLMVLLLVVLVGAVLVGGGERRGSKTLDMGGNPPHPLVWVDEVEG